MNPQDNGNVDRVRASAIAAAEKNESPASACPYSFGSAAGRLWMIEYTKQLNRINARERAARDQLRQGGNHAPTDQG